MNEVRIYQPAKNAMQSGRANTKSWVLEFVPNRKSHDRLMGWVGSDDTTNQIKLRFASKDEAVAYATERGLSYSVHDPKPRRIVPKSYAANYAPRRVV